MIEKGLTPPDLPNERKTLTPQDCLRRGSRHAFPWHRDRGRLFRPQQLDTRSRTRVDGRHGQRHRGLPRV